MCWAGKLCKEFLVSLTSLAHRTRSEISIQNNTLRANNSLECGLTAITYWQGFLYDRLPHIILAFESCKKKTLKSKHLLRVKLVFRLWWMWLQLSSCGWWCELRSKVSLAWPGNSLNQFSPRTKTRNHVMAVEIHKGNIFSANHTSVNDRIPPTQFFSTVTLNKYINKASDLVYVESDCCKYLCVHLTESLFAELSWEPEGFEWSDLWNFHIKI